MGFFIFRKEFFMTEILISEIKQFIELIPYILIFYIIFDFLGSFFFGGR